MSTISDLIRAPCKLPFFKIFIFENSVDPNHLASSEAASQDPYFFHSHNKSMLIRPNKKISVFLVTGLKILGRVGTHIFFNYHFFSGNTIIYFFKKT